MTDEQPKILAELTYEGADLIHNDLISAAYHIKQRVDAAVAGGDRAGIGLDVMAAVTMIAFAFEAYLNFVGDKVIANFKERQSGLKKRDAVMKSLGIQWDSNARPFSTIEQLFHVRDVMAHGKPRYFKDRWEEIGTHSELEQKLYSYRKGLEADLTVEFMSNAYDDVEILWRLMLKEGKIRPFDTLDGGVSGITFKAFVEPGSN